MVRFWEAAADRYDGVVSNTRNAFLRGIMDEEQALLEEAIRDLAKLGSKVSVLEVGAGTGRSLLKCAGSSAISANLQYLIGIDNAITMCAIARQERNYRYREYNIRQEIVKQIIFLNMDGTNLSHYFYEGDILMAHLRTDESLGEDPDHLRKLQARKWKDSRKVVSNMLNTLGIIRPKRRRQVIRNMLFAVQPGDKLVFSVLAGESFDEMARYLYRDLKPLVGKFDEKAFYHDRYDFITDSYYSHWFTKQEIESLILEVAKMVAIPINIEVVPLSPGGHFAVCDRL